MEEFLSNFEKDSEKAGYNASAKIIEILGYLRAGFTAEITQNNFSGALEYIRAILNIISGKVTQEDVKEMDKRIFEIEEHIPNAEASFIYQGKRYWRNGKIRIVVKRKIELAYRELERLQNKYGYGMISKDDPRFAVLQR